MLIAHIWPYITLRKLLDVIIAHISDYNMLLLLAYIVLTIQILSLPLILIKMYTDVGYLFHHVAGPAKML